MAADPDRDLLARLNALTKSPISFAQQNASLSDHAPASQLPADDSITYTDLATRFRKLGGKDSIVATTNHQNGHYQPWQGTAAETAHDEEDERTIEELLSDIGPEEQWSLDADESKHVEKLLSEAKQVLPFQHGHRDAKARKRRSKDEDGEERDSSPGDKGEDGDRQLRPGLVDWKAFRDMDEENKEPRVAQRDDEEAEEYIAKVLAELDLKKTYGVDKEEDAQKRTSGRQNIETSDGTSNDKAAGVRTFSPSPPHPSSPSQETTFNLPDTPTTLPSSTLAATDSPLSSLPSAPSFAPSSKPPVTASKKSALHKYTDEEINSWCCICLDDATVECLGCAQEGTDDGDNLYCESCWREGHRGEGAGFEERTHRAVRLERGSGGVKRRGKKKVAVGAR